MLDLVTAVNRVLWGPVMIYGILAIGLLFSVLTKFVQIRLVKDMVLHMFASEKSGAGVSSFQALIISLSGRAGTGNIVGTASAIAFGGPGAVFWMWVTAFIGGASAFVESTLAQIYKEQRGGQHRGGPAFYIEKGTGQRWFGILFALSAIVATVMLLPGVQTNAVAGAMEEAFRLQPWVTGMLFVVCLSFVLLGGVRTIASAASFMMPLLALAYLVVAAVVIFMHMEDIPRVFMLIMGSAFSMDATFGGMVGASISWGVKRAIFSNEAGQGTGAHPAAAAEVSHPVKQGLVQAGSVYIDTLLICTATALMILFMGTYNTYDGSKFVAEYVPGMTYSQFTQLAVTNAFPMFASFGSSFIAVSLFFFAFMSLIAYYYIAEMNVAFFMSGWQQVVANLLLKVMLVIASFSGTVRSADLAWALGDMGLGVMVWINVGAMLFMIKPALIALKDYESQRQLGKDPVFKPKQLGIKHTSFWKKYE